MKYRDPPVILNPMFNALCMLFDREERCRHVFCFMLIMFSLSVYSWEECQRLLMTPKFMDSLKFFDRDHIPQKKVHRLKKMIGQHMQFEAIKYGSKASVSMTMWLNALVDYHQVKVTMEPLRKELAIAEETLNNVRIIITSTTHSFNDKTCPCACNRPTKLLSACKRTC